jgi:HEAT repeat protein
LTVCVAAADPPKQPDAKELAGWIVDLDSDLFATRTKAREELKKLGYDARPALRRALANKPTAEVRNAIEHLLGSLDGIDIREVKVPKGIKLLEVKDLLARHRDQLKSSDATTRGLAAGALGGLADYADVVPDLIGVLKEDTHEYARRSAAGALSRLGKRATSALPVLKAGLEDPDVNVRNAYTYAIKQIEDGKESKRDEEQARRLKALLEAISAYVKAQPAGPKE